MQPPLYLFVLGLSLKAKAIKQKTTGGPKKWKVQTWFFSSVGMEVHVRRPNYVTNILSFINRSLLSFYRVPGGRPWWLRGKESAYQCKRYGFNPGVRKITWRRKWQPTPVFLPGKSHGQRSLVGYSPWGHKRIGCDLATKNNNYVPDSFLALRKQVTI